MTKTTTTRTSKTAKTSPIEVFKPFSFEQKHLIEAGALHTQALYDWVTEALSIKRVKVVAKRHWYVVSPPGLGKTYTVQRAAREHNVDLVMVQGATSLPAFVRKIAFAVYSHVVLNKSKKPMFVCVDDCDELFSDKKNLNVMKGVMDNERNVLAYEVDMTNQIKAYRAAESATTQLIADAMEYYQSQGGLGLEIPMEQVCFIVLSNKELASEADSRAKPAKMHETAVRSRVNYRPINATGKEMWGFAASVLLNSDVLGDEHKLTEAQKHILLDFMYSNWDKMPGTDLRSITEYAADMINSPADYIDRWTMRLEH